MTTTTMQLPQGGMAYSCMREHGLALVLAVALHIAIGAALLNLSSGPPMAPAAANVITTQLVTLPPSPPPAIAPTLANVEAPEEVIQPSAPPPALPEPAVEAPSVAQADLALQRIKQQHLAQEKREERERKLRREEETRRDKLAKAEQERLQHEQLAQASKAEADRKLAAAKAAAMQAAEEAQSHQYLPIAKEAPDYPARALERQIEGECTVSYIVNVNGQVESPQIAGTCHPLFIKPSLAAAKTFRYRPKVVNGQAVAVANVKNTFTYRIK